MAIIISKNGKNAVKVEKSTFEKEDFLQQYIYENPESIPLYDIKEDIRLLILAREFPTASGPIDAIGVDRDGEIYVVETKLFRNADKRTVVAQALDYGAALWKHSGDFASFASLLDAAVQETFSLPLASKLREFFNLSEEEAAVLLDGVRRNLAEGAFRFVVLMDKLDARLKDLIIFVNQNSQFDVYAVEFEYYKHETQEIIIPKLFGAEVKKEMAVSSSGPRRKWTEDSVLRDAQQKLSAEEFAAFKKIYEFSKANADEVRLGTGSYGSFSAIFSSISPKSLFTLGADRRLAFNFEWIANDNERVAELFHDKLTAIGFSFPDNFKRIRPSVLPDEWLNRTDDFLNILRSMLGGE